MYAMAKAMEHLIDFVFGNMANTTFVEKRLLPVLPQGWSKGGYFECSQISSSGTGNPVSGQYHQAGRGGYSRL